MNNHIIHGRLVRDPELTPRKNSDSSDRVNFTVAVDRRYGDETDFFDCVAFGKTAELIDKWLAKGREVIVWGEGQIHSYEDKNGVICGSKGDSKKADDSWNQFDEDNPF